MEKQRLRLQAHLHKQLKRRSTHKRLVRYGLIAANVAVLGVVAFFVIGGSHSDRPMSASALSSRATTDNVPLDGVTSFDIAANVARMTNLPESTPINNQAQSAQVAVAVSTSDVNVIAKPQIVMTELKSRNDIQNYTVQPGDTTSSIAQKFGVTSDSVKWSNDLSSDSVALGAKLVIPPVNGIVYSVKAGDTVQSLATKFKANVDQIVAFNDAELSGIKAGEQVLIPNGQVAAARATYGGISAGTGRLLGSSSFTAQYGSNGYDYGYCTYYAAARSGAPSNWGNANTWAYYAALSGWTVSSSPRVGAIAQTTSGYLGHVAIVEEVSADGSQIKYSDMNGIAGWGRVGYSGWMPSSHFEHYIYR